MLVESVPVKLHVETYKLLQKVRGALPGNPSYVGLLDEAVKLLAEKYLERGEENVG